MQKEPQHIDNEENETDDVVFENDAEYSERDPKQELQKLKKRLTDSEEKAREYLDGWQRAKAEFLNARKRDGEHNAEVASYARAEIIEDLIPVLDSFDMAMRNKTAWESAPKDWRVGVEYIYQQLLSVLSKHGVSQFSPEGKPFDPQYHDAVDNVTVTDQSQDGIVVEVIQKGYTMNGKVLRGAKVKTGHFNN